METPSRRDVLTVAAATVTLPMVQAALGGLKSAQAAAATPPATRPAPARGGNTPAPDEKPGWFTTTIKAADVKDNQFTAVEGHAIAIARSGKTVTALTSKCSHRGCAINLPQTTAVLTCQCHNSKFNLDGSVAGPPANQPLAHYAIRQNAAGLIEVDPGTKPEKDAKEFSITLA